MHTYNLCHSTTHSTHSKTVIKGNCSSVLQLLYPRFTACYQTYEWELWVYTQYTIHIYGAMKTFAVFAWIFCWLVNPFAAATTQTYTCLYTWWDGLSSQSIDATILYEVTQRQWSVKEKVYIYELRIQLFRNDGIYIRMCKFEQRHSAVSISNNTGVRKQLSIRWLAIYL